MPPHLAIHSPLTPSDGGVVRVWATEQTGSALPGPRPSQVMNTENQAVLQAPHHEAAS